MAAASLKSIFMALPSTQTKMVVWLVPSETILSQTYKNLSNVAHPYRQRLDIDFNGQVAVYNKMQLLMGENFSPIEVADQLSILVLSYDSFRTSNREGRKAYQQNGQLNKFVLQFADNEEILENADITSLIQVIRHYKPIIIVDESHHATTNLSVEMLKNFSPSFVLELTATPKENSNVIAYVPAAKLKSAGMVKLPVIVYNRYTQDDVIADSIDFRNLLEKVGQPEKIRPIILFQAETQGSSERTTFDRIKNILIQNHNIPPEQIAIKTSDINDLKNVDLMSENCPIRYIITVNALKEGWDCPFAYVLASLANRTSPIDVEQILGRILRRPFTKNFSEELLNMSYVFTSSADFRQTLEKIIIGLNSAGFSEKEYRAVINFSPMIETDLSEKIKLEQQNIFSQSSEIFVLGGDSSPKEILTDDDDDLHSSKNFVDEMERQARQESEIYNTENNDNENIRSNEEKDRMTDFPMRDKFLDAQEILLPQFFCHEDTGHFFEGVHDEKVDKAMFRTKFSLSDKDTIINFDNLNYEIVSFDVHDKEDFPRYKYLSDAEVKAFLEYFDNLTPEGKIRQCALKIASIIDKDNSLPSKHIIDYVMKIISAFDRERIREVVQHSGVYARKIKEKIDSLLDDFAHKKFMEQIDSKKIFAKPSYRLPAINSPIRFQKSWANSLYVAEEEMNSLEFKVAAKLTSFDNVLW